MTPADHQEAADDLALRVVRTIADTVEPLCDGDPTRQRWLLHSAILNHILTITEDQEPDHVARLVAAFRRAVEEHDRSHG